MTRRPADMRSHAFCLANQGLPCFPCDDNKRPLTLHGFKDASRDPEEVGRLWRDHAGTLIGVPTGQVSGLDVLDIDPRNGGANWFANRRAELPHTRVHRTRSGGLHLLFEHEAGLRCSAGKLAAGVDVRACGGYVIWWPAAGLPVLSDIAPASWPAWLSTALREHRPGPASHVRLPDSVLLAGLIRAVARAPHGQRNSLTYWAGCRAGEMVMSGLLDASLAAEAIADAATRAGLTLVEGRRTVWSGIRKTTGARHA